MCTTTMYCSFCGGKYGAEGRSCLMTQHGIMCNYCLHSVTERRAAAEAQARRDRRAEMEGWAKVACVALR